MISVEIKDIDKHEQNAAEVEIYLDKAGLECMLKELKLLVNRGDHCHFMNPSWGGYELSDTATVEGNVAMPHLKITCLGE